MAKIMTVRPPDRLHNILRDMARERGYTLNQLVLQILWEWVKNEERRGRG